MHLSKKTTFHVKSWKVTFLICLFYSEHSSMFEKCNKAMKLKKSSEMQKSSKTTGTSTVRSFVAQLGINKRTT